MASSLSNLVEVLGSKGVKVGIHKIKWKDCGCFLECGNVKDSWIKLKCLSFNKDFSKRDDKELKHKFKNTFKFSKNDINNFILLLRKGFILMNIWMIGKSLI